MAVVRRPNVLWLMSDQHNAACMSHAGRSVRTPHLDALAARGVRFSQAFCNNPICAPSRVTFISGQYPHSHGHLGNTLFDYPEGNPNTIAALARRGGYQTAVIGKAHMLRAWDQEGFEYRRYCDLADADNNDPLSNHYFRYLYEQGLADRYDLGTLPPGHPGQRSLWFVSTIPHEHSLEVWTGDETVRFLQQRDRQRPFLLQMSFQRPHAPLSPSPERAHMYRPKEIDLPDNAVDLFERRFATKPAFQREHITRRGAYPHVPEDSEELRRQLTHYYALVTIIDEQIGRVLDVLRQSGDLENTVVVYVSDHGDFAGEHGLMQKNLGIYESIQRIPFILVYPGCPAGRQVTDLVESVDLYPTLADLMHLETPEGVDGSSLLPLLAGEQSGKEAVICEWAHARHGPLVLALRTADYRLVYYGREQEGELYDRRSDPGELINRYTDPAYQPVRLHLLERILDQTRHFRKKTDVATDRREDALTRNSLTRLIHKGMKSWSDIAPLYRQ